MQDLAANPEYHNEVTCIANKVIQKAVSYALGGKVLSQEVFEARNNAKSLLNRLEALPRAKQDDYNDGHNSKKTRLGDEHEPHPELTNYGDASPHDVDDMLGVTSSFQWDAAYC